MYFEKLFFVLAWAAAVLAHPGFLHDEAHHTHEVLENIHQAPHCSYPCIFDESYQNRFAPECHGLVGKEFGACLCRANAYQYIVDQCVDRKCSGGERKTV
jgi:CFEM domain